MVSTKVFFPGSSCSVEAAEAVALVLFEAAIHQLRRRVRDKLRASAFGDEERILYQQSFGKILIVGQDGSAVTGAESRGNNLDVIRIGNLFHLVRRASSSGEYMLMRSIPDRTMPLKPCSAAVRIISIKPLNLYRT